MIQRVQTLFLLLAVILLTIMLFNPIATIPSSDGELLIKPFVFGDGAQESISQVSATIYLSLLLVATVAISFFSIFCYRNRPFQTKLCVINIGLLIGLQIFVAFAIYRATGYIGQMNSEIPNYSAGLSYSIVSVFPIISAIASYLALRNIIKDELLIKSLNRLR
ncbi:MAG: DUF4293 domain-containing protein [Rikenellaceae bacterium]